MNRELKARAELFHQLHAGPAPLMLPNAWDAASARVIENAGAKAIATTSAGMAWALGYPDGERLPVEELLAACRRICQVVSAPVSVDIERGYGRDAEDTGDLVDELIQLGVVGINIEDGTDPGTQTLAHPSVLRERIACVRSIAQQRDLPFFINARIDTYLSNLPPEARLEETRKRALAYIDAGANGVFVPGLADAEEIATLVRLLPVPLNIYAGYPGAPSAQALQQLGARRISLGCGPMQAMLAHLGAIAAEALDSGHYDTMGKRMLTPAEANGLFSANAHKTARPREVPYIDMGDGPVAQLIARQRRSSLRGMELTTRNSGNADQAPAWKRLIASMFGDRTASAVGQERTS